MALEYFFHYMYSHQFLHWSFVFKTSLEFYRHELLKLSLEVKTNNNIQYDHYYPLELCTADLFLFLFLIFNF